jgi:hypothetical protein
MRAINAGRHAPARLDPKFESYRRRLPENRWLGSRERVIQTADLHPAETASGIPCGKP